MKEIKSKRTEELTKDRNKRKNRGKVGGGLHDGDDDLAAATKRNAALHTESMRGNIIF